MAERLKDIFFTPNFVTSLTSEIKKVYPDFKHKKFLSEVLNEDYLSLELKERMRKISLSLGNHLPEKYSEALKILYHVSQKFPGFNNMIFPDYVECFGLDDTKNSFKALKYFTPFGSSEYGVRPFIKKYPDETLNYLLKLSTDKNHHVRRFSSEGCRPRLPWAMALHNLQKDPTPILPILENLKNDSSLYVRKSVANNMNDISKDHPDLVLKIAKRWIGNSKNTDWIIKHALRTLLKRANKEALKLFGFDSLNNFEVKNFSIKDKKNKIGNSTEFTFHLNIKKKTLLRIEYAIYFIKMNGAHSKKVFQITEKEFEKGEYDFNKKHSFKNLTTRKHLPGEHFISLIINGKEKEKLKFELV